MISHFGDASERCHHCRTFEPSCKAGRSCRRTPSESGQSLRSDFAGSAQIVLPVTLMLKVLPRFWLPHHRDASTEIRPPRQISSLEQECTPFCSVWIEFYTNSTRIGHMVYDDFRNNLPRNDWLFSYFERQDETKLNLVADSVLQPVFC